MLCASTFIISCHENNSAESLKINFQKEFTHFPSTPGESERRCCSPTGCSAALWPPSSPAAQENQGKICQKQIHLTLNFYYLVEKTGQRRQVVPASGPSCARSGRTAAARVRFGRSASCSRRRSRSAAAHKAGEAAQVTTGPPKLQQQQEGKKNKGGREGERDGGRLTLSFLNWQPVVSVVPLGQVVAFR